MNSLKWFHGLIVFVIFIIFSQVVGMVLLALYSMIDPTFQVTSIDTLLSKEGIIIQSVGMFISFLTVPILWLLLLSKPIKPSFNLSRPLNKDILFTVLGILSVGTIIQYIVDLLVKWNPSWKYGLLLQVDFHEKIAQVIHTDNVFVMLIFVIVIGILPGFGEEFLFRGFIQRIYSNKMNIFWSIFLSGGLFGLLHTPQQISQAIAAFLITFYLGYIFHKTGNLWVPIIAHMVNNSFFVILLFFIPSAKDMFTGGMSIIPVLISVPIAGYSIHYFWKRVNVDI